MISVHQIQENRTSIDFEQSISSLMSRKLRKFLIQFMLDKILIHTKIDKKISKICMYAKPFTSENVTYSSIFDAALL